jgi:fatty-acid desaturase
MKKKKKKKKEWRRKLLKYLSSLVSSPAKDPCSSYFNTMNGTMVVQFHLPILIILCTKVGSIATKALQHRLIRHLSMRSIDQLYEMC